VAREEILQPIIVVRGGVFHREHAMRTRHEPQVGRSVARGQNRPARDSARAPIPSRRPERKLIGPIKMEVSACTLRLLS
jgi:hypothetical protein